MSKGAQCPPGRTYHGTQSNHPSSRASDGPTIAVTFSQPCHSWSQTVFFFFFFSLSALICSRWNCDSLVSTSNTKISFPRVTFSSTSFVYSVDGYYVSQGQVQVWMFVHFNLLYVGSLISRIKWCETGINKGWEQN